MGIRLQKVTVEKLKMTLSFDIGHSGLGTCSGLTVSLRMGIVLISYIFLLLEKKCHVKILCTSGIKGWTFSLVIAI